MSEYNNHSLYSVEKNVLEILARHNLYSPYTEKDAKAAATRIKVMIEMEIMARLNKLLLKESENRFNNAISDETLKSAKKHSYLYKDIERDEPADDPTEYPKEYMSDNSFIIETYKVKYPFIDFEETDTGIYIRCGDIGVAMEKEAASLDNMEMLIRVVVEKAAEVYAGRKDE